MANSTAARESRTTCKTYYYANTPTAKSTNHHVVTKRVPCRYVVGKRALDLILSSLAIVVLFIPMLIIGLAIFLQDRHNPIFRQIRVTKGGRFFTMYKFRSMYIDAEERLDELRSQNEANGPVFKMKNDPRITPLGRFLRRTSLDELPQFFNVWTGKMSLVGPRPPLPREVELYTPYQAGRLNVKAGMTCYWQCSGRSNIMFDEWVELDLKYIREQSMITDTKILAKTVGAVLHSDGAH